jgi:predicted metal-binding membrane protein
VAVASSAWLVLVAVGVSPYAQYVDHDYAPQSAAAQVAALALFLGGWLLMSIAMMLPTTTRLLHAFGRTVGRRQDRRMLQSLLIAGFLATWLATGYVFRSGDLGVHATVDSWGWLRERPQLLGAAVLVLAGLFQFSSLKHRCLTACRSPRSFVYRHWHGRNARVEALRIGFAYGVSCVGCCWALMLVLFAVGMANLAWMLALAAVMALEKNTRRGAALARPVGVGLIALGITAALA